MWLEALYEPTTLFSLRKSDSTNPAAKTLISPSPYSVKMALLNACITFFSKDTAVERFDFIRDLEIRINLPEYLCVNNCFVKIQKEPKEPQPGKAFQTTVGFREYVYYNDEIKILFSIKDDSEEKFLKSLLIRINYFGKRGCFFQHIGFNKYYGDEILDGYSYPFSRDCLEDGKRKILMNVDDFAKDTSFENVNTYSDKKGTRDNKVLCFNYQRIKANKSFTLYRKAK